MLLLLALGSQRQVVLWEFKASLIYMTSSRPPMATYFIYVYECLLHHKGLYPQTVNQRKHFLTLKKKSTSEGLDRRPRAYYECKFASQYPHGAVHN